MKWLQTILDGIYPTHEVWLLRTWLVIIGFEIIVAMVEASLVYWYLSKNDVVSKGRIILIVIIGNIITFIIGVILQALLVGFL